MLDTLRYWCKVKNSDKHRSLKLTDTETVQLIKALTMTNDIGDIIQ